MSVGGIQVTTASAKSVLEQMYLTGKSAKEIILKQGLDQIKDTSSILAVVKRVMVNNPKALADYKAGKRQSLKFLVGQVMKATGDRANPTEVNQLMEERLSYGN